MTTRIHGLLALLLLLQLPAWAADAPMKPEYARHVEALKPKVPEGFTIVVEEPFVVIGDESPADVKAFAKDTVRWAVKMLSQDYFGKPPSEIYDIWLFKGKESYERNTEAIFHEKPISPYGYCSGGRMLMNIATGGGTLVHEIVHAYIASNFPGCPTWFNEGLASLYEQCGAVDGYIHGYPNWRLPGLKEAIKAGRTPSFEKLMAMDQAEFYADWSACYGQARYLCYYMQEKGLLVKFYKEFRDNAKDDPRARRRSNGSSARRTSTPSRPAGKRK